jgi:hypothetical protein
MRNKLWALWFYLAGLIMVGICLGHMFTTESGFLAIGFGLMLLSGLIAFKS